MKKVIKYSVLILLLVVMIITLLELVSSYTPARTINRNAPVTTQRSIVIHAPAEKVWRVFTEVDKWPQWQKEIVSASLAAPFEPGSVIDWKTNGFSIHSQLQTVNEYKQIGWAGEAFGSFAIHIWNFEEKDGYTTVTVEESMDGWLVSLMKGYVQENLHKSTEYWLQALKQESEK